ncbi:MAG: GAF domain-containing sensor histidine kinase [Acidimicrobiia bacterium]
MSSGGAPSSVGSSDYADGHGQGLVGIGGMWRTWQTSRIAISVVAVVSGIALGVLWAWPGGFAAAVMGLIALVYAVRLIRSETGSPLPPLFMDTTLIGVAMVMVGLEPEGMGAALLYMMAIPLVLLPWRRALPVIAYAILWAVAAVAAVHFMDKPVEVSDQVVTAIAYVVFAGPTLVLLGVIAFQLDRLYRYRARRLRYEKALAACGEALLANPADKAIDTALVALLGATPAQNIFVDENFADPVLGLSCRVTHETIRAGSEHLVSEEIWVEDDEPTKVLRTVLPYADMPTLHAGLSNGEVAVIHRDRLEGREREIYEEDGCMSELNIPINVYGKWVGSIGFADYVMDRDWRDDDISVLQTAAAMIGSFWERAQATRELEDLVVSKDQFLASISHEIRTPLTAVLGFSEVLREDPGNLGPGGVEMVNLVAEQAREISDIVEDLLVAARADMNALKVVREAVDLREQVDHVVAARGSRTPLSISSDGGDVVAMADGNRVRQIVRCLLSNAVRYGGEQIEIRIGCGDGRATLTVADDGPGVPPGHERNIFEAFHRARNDDGKTQAIGLGLFVAHHLALLMDGDLTYDRRSGWTIFELELPGSEYEEDVSYHGEPAGNSAASMAHAHDVDLLVPDAHG